MKKFNSPIWLVALAPFILFALSGCGGNTNRHSLLQQQADTETSPTDTEEESDEEFVDPLDSFTTIQDPSPSPSPSVSASASPDAPEAEVSPTSSPSSSPSPSASPLPSPRPTPKTIAVIGEGTAVGLHASHTRGSALSPRQIFNLDESGKAYRHRDAGDLDHNINTKLNFATGLDDSLKSIARRLRSLNSSIKIYNAASAVADSDEMLGAQLDQVQTWSEGKTNESAPDVVIISAGLTDLCADSTAGMTSAADFGDRMYELMDRLLSANSRTRILIVAVAPYHTLYANLKDRIAYRHYVGIGTKCKEVWDDTGICTTLTRSNTKSAVQARIQAYNASLSSSVSLLTATHGSRVRMVTENAAGSINPDDLGFDCLHLSHEGQARLADRVWKASWWK